jgi:hypothetical protein
MCELTASESLEYGGGRGPLETRLVTATRVLSAHSSMTLISPVTPGKESSGWATRSKEGFSTSSVCGLAFRDSIRAERDGVYEGMYRSENIAAFPAFSKGWDP